MKKLISLTLALLLVFSLATVASAGTVPSYEQDGEIYTDMGTVELKKAYKTVNGGTSPAEEFTFSNVTCVSVPEGVDKDSLTAMPQVGSISFTEGAANADGTGTAIGTATITLPALESYPKVGEYKYTFNENASNNAGVGTRTDVITLVVTIVQDDTFETGGTFRIGAVHCEASSGTKTNTFYDNTYTAGALTVKKEVYGGLGDRDAEFKIVVTFTNNTGKTIGSAITYGENQSIEFTGNTGTAEITLKHGESVKFENIPEGVTYSVVETAESAAGYDVKYVVDDGDEVTEVSAAMASADVEVTVKNTSKGTVDTGITLDSIPFILILAVCAGAVVLFVVKRRRSVDF